MLKSADQHKRYQQRIRENARRKFTDFRKFEEGRPSSKMSSRKSSRKSTRPSYQILSTNPSSHNRAKASPFDAADAHDCKNNI